MTLQEILSVGVDTLTRVKLIADLPGVNALPYAATVSSAISLVLAAYETGKDVEKYVDKLRKTFSGDGAPTAAEMAELEAEIEALTREVMAPLPPREEGEPE